MDTQTKNIQYNGHVIFEKILQGEQRETEEGRDNEKLGVYGQLKECGLD
jgi:hypothetical protein